MKISCLIPTYNEEPRITHVLSIVASHPLVDEVLVIDDCSKDNTPAVVNKLKEQFPKIRLIIHEKNGGKSKAICTGIKESTGDFLMFIDADLIGLNEQNLTDLIKPVIDGQADITISLRKNTPAIWKKIGLDYISGERVMPRNFLLPIADVLPTLPKFGLESYMNKQLIKSKFRIKIVNWPNVESPYKYKKVGLWKGIKGDALMILDIFRTITPIGPAYQIIKMKNLEVK